MTQNQIRYQEFLEAQRHNAATEAEVLRHNVVAEQQTSSSLSIAAQQAAASNTSAGASYLNALTNQYNAQTTRDKYQTDAYTRGVELGLEQQRIDLEKEKQSKGTWGEKARNLISAVGTAMGFITAR